jgi:hypothetical protein
MPTFLASYWGARLGFLGQDFQYKKSILCSSFEAFSARLLHQACGAHWLRAVPHLQ